MYIKTGLFEVELHSTKGVYIRLGSKDWYIWF